MVSPAGVMQAIRPSAISFCWLDRHAHQMAARMLALVLEAVGRGQEGRVVGASHGAVEQIVAAAVGADRSQHRLDPLQELLATHRARAAVLGVEAIARIDDEPVLQGQRLVVLIGVERDLLDVGAVGVHHVDHARRSWW